MTAVCGPAESTNTSEDFQFTSQAIPGMLADHVIHNRKDEKDHGATTGSSKLRAEFVELN